jgi:hypothetical protein
VPEILGKPAQPVNVKPAEMLTDGRSTMPNDVELKVRDAFRVRENEFAAVE